MRAAYVAAALLGLACALAIFPADFILPSAGQSWRPAGDTAQHIAAQRWFLSEPWSWSLLHIRTLNAPEGLNLAFADGIPLLALPLKLLAPLLPPGFHGIGLWHFFCWVLQPVGAKLQFRRDFHLTGRPGQFGHQPFRAACNGGNPTAVP